MLSYSKHYIHSKTNTCNTHDILYTHIYTILSSHQVLPICMLGHFLQVLNCGTIQTLNAMKNVHIYVTLSPP